MWYRVGTVAVTNGLPNIVGTGTAWTEAIEQGWAFLAPDGKLYEVLAVNSDTEIELATNYAGSTDSGEAYAMFPTQGLVRSLTTQVLALISSFGGIATGAGAGKFGDGTVAAPGISFASDPDCGFYRIGTNTFGWATAGSLRVVVDGSGLVGIGVASPSNTLHLKAASNPVIRLEGAADSGYLDYNGTRMQLSAGGGEVRLVAGNAVRARVDINGNFIMSAPAVAPTLTAERELVLNMVSNTVLRIAGRGADGVTRTVDLTLA